MNPTKTKRKRDEESSATKKKAVSDSTEPPSKKTKQAAKEKQAEEPRTFATTAEWLESERWSLASVSDGPDFFATVTSPNVELWLVKAPAQFDASALEDRELSLEHFTELAAGRPASSFTVATADGKSYVVQAADPGEYRQLIDLIPATSEERLLLGKPFERGFNITEAVETQPISVVPVRPRPIVPQPSNLRLRFRPPGYVMTKREIKEEEMRAKKHAKAVDVAKHTPPPLRPVPIANKGIVVSPPEAESPMDEDEEAEESAPVDEEDEAPLVRKKKKSDKEDQTKSPKKQKKKKAATSESVAPASSEASKKKKKRKSKGGKEGN